MPAATPNTEPASFTAGETLAWTRDLPDYPASLYLLKYAFQAQGKALITIAAGASGDTHAVNVAPAVSGGYSPGEYLLTAFVERIGDPTERHILGHSPLRILPSPLLVLGATHASRMLALIECALENRIPAGLEMTNIDGQELGRMKMVELEAMQRRYQAKVALEVAAARAAAGLKTRRSIGVRFVRP